MAAWWLLNLVVFLHVVLTDTPLWVTYVYNGLLYVVGAIISYREPIVRSVFTVGTVAGILELGVDHFLVGFTGTLVYPEGGPMLLSSPAYMPLAWAIVITHLGYLGVRFNEVFGRRVAAIGPGIAAMTLVGFYEYGAYLAEIWEYIDAPLVMLGHVPLYIVLAEGIMFSSLHEVVRLDRPVVGGIVFAIMISASYAVTYSVCSILGNSVV